MSENDASGSYDKPDYDYRDDTNYDRTVLAGGEAAKGGKASKWTVALVAVVGGLGAIGAIFGDSLPKCDSSTSRGMIEDLYLQVPLNTAQATVADLTGITETAYDKDAKVRSCQATLIDSAGAQHAIVWSTTDAGETYDYELEVKT
jgi:hypothetical protein